MKVTVNLDCLGFAKETEEMDDIETDEEESIAASSPYS